MTHKYCQTVNAQNLQYFECVVHIMYGQLKSEQPNCVRYVKIFSQYVQTHCIRQNADELGAE